MEEGEGVGRVSDQRRKMLKNAKAGRPARIPLSNRTNSNPTSPSSCGSIGPHLSEPISAFCNRIHTLNERTKNKKNAVTSSVTASPIPKISNVRDKSDGVEGLNMPKTKPLTVPGRKKRCVASYEQDVSKDSQLQDYIDKQNAYFREIDEFELSEEEVESIDELD
ncbi:hypothetical protein RJT34_09127 [Clitoria ternatea]|uniref:Sororin C-terminal region domain-containing protein n=1 Tax=Clitoria ternatea TaxID=43366 RepID=A0AAN9K6J5_CLITE